MTTLSLYEVTVESYLQLLPALSGVLDTAATHCAENNIDPDSLLDERLADDMWPLSNQLDSVRHHSQRAIEGVEAGLFQPPAELSKMNFADFQQFIADTTDYLESLDVDRVNALGDKPLMFKAGKFEVDFTGANFLLSFSLPNFYFHVTTSYDILRKIGVPLGKMHYLGKLKTNG